MKARFVVKRPQARGGDYVGSFNDDSQYVSLGDEKDEQRIEIHYTRWEVFFEMIQAINRSMAPYDPLEVEGLDEDERP